MKKALFITLLLQVLAYNQPHAILEESRGECEKYVTEVERLNNTNYGFFEFHGFDDYLNDGNFTPACTFRKKSSGYISIETMISKDSTFFEVDARLNSFEENFAGRFTGFEKYCIFETTNYYLSDTPDGTGKHALNFSGDTYCFSQNDISFVENLDVLNLLKKSGSETGFTVEMTGAPSPVISGTTIHN